MTSQVRILLRARDSAFRSGDRDLYSAARADLRRGIRAAKADFKRRIEDQLTSNNPHHVWQGIQSITNYRGCDETSRDSGVALAEELNSFFARFETQTQHSAIPLQPPPASSTPPLTLEVQDVRRVLWSVNPRKAAGPDGVPGKVLNACAYQLSQVFTDIFNLSLAQAA